MFEDVKIWIRGAGELASATAVILHKCGFKIIASELPTPLAIRRTVTFSDAMRTGSAIVEDVTARNVHPDKIEATLSNNEIPLLQEDPDLSRVIKTKLIIDARMLKKDIGNSLHNMAIVIGLGPGFTVGENCRMVIETKRGHDLGRIIRDGSAARDTGVPGELGGETFKRVILAKRDGDIDWKVDIGNLVLEGELMGAINQVHEITSPLKGIVRGLINPETPVHKGLKIADVDPRGREVDINHISDKSRAVGRGVLEAIMQMLNQAGHK